MTVSDLLADRGAGEAVLIDPRAADHAADVVLPGDDDHDDCLPLRHDPMRARPPITPLQP